MPHRTAGCGKSSLRPLMAGCARWRPGTLIRVFPLDAVGKSDNCLAALGGRAVLVRGAGGRLCVGKRTLRPRLSRRRRAHCRRTRAPRRGAPAPRPVSRQAILLARIYEAFPLVCPVCRTEMRRVAFIADSASITRTLERLGEPARAPGRCRPREDPRGGRRCSTRPPSSTRPPECPCPSTSLTNRSVGRGGEPSPRGLRRSHRGNPRAPSRSRSSPGRLLPVSGCLYPGSALPHALS